MTEGKLIEKAKSLRMKRDNMQNERELRQMQTEMSKRTLEVDIYKQKKEKKRKKKKQETWRNPPKMAQENKEMAWSRKWNRK